MQSKPTWLSFQADDKRGQDLLANKLDASGKTRHSIREQVEIPGSKAADGKAFVSSERCP